MKACLLRWYHSPGPFSRWDKLMPMARAKMAALKAGALFGAARGVAISRILLEAVIRSNGSPGGTYSFLGKVLLPDVRGSSTSASLHCKDLSELLRGKGLFLEGKIRVNNEQAYFHLIMFDPQSVRAELFIDSIGEQIAAVGIQEIPRGVCYPGEETERAIGKLRCLGISGFPGLFNCGMTIQDISRPGLIMVTDATNYPYNEGFFLVRDGRLLDQRIASRGKQWILAKTGNRLTAKLIDLDDPRTFESVQMGIYLNPVIIRGRTLSLGDVVPGTNETMLYSFRGCHCHIFQESTPEIAGHIQDLVAGSRTGAGAELTRLLKEQGVVGVPYRASRETATALALSRGYGENVAQDLSAGQFAIDDGRILVAPRRALYGHTIIGMTKSGRVLMFKIFNRARKDNGVYIEQIGPLVEGVFRSLGEEVEYAGVAANGGDVRTYLGSIGSYKNAAEDGGVIQEKIGGDAVNRTRKPVILAFFGSE